MTLPYGRSGCDMAAITAHETVADSSTMTGAEELLEAFTEHNRELTWLAEFLIDDETMASVCVMDARNVIDSNDELCQECVPGGPRGATIRFALDLKRTRIAELSSAYESADCNPQQHPRLSLEKIELVVMESDVIRRRLDSLCRFVLVLCGIQHHSVRDVAGLLGISRHAVEAAYRNALGLLEVIYCQDFLESYGMAAA